MNINLEYLLSAVVVSYLIALVVVLREEDVPRESVYIAWVIGGACILGATTLVSTLILFIESLFK